MAKFKVGDRARVYEPETKGHLEECVIVAIGHVSMIGEPSDYEVKFINSAYDHPSKTTWGMDAHQLEPIIELGDWSEIEESIGWNPTKQLEGV